MSELGATVRLRPTRIGLLVRPTDVASIRRFMRICTCLWGGVNNPIIPVFRSPPRDWRPPHRERIRSHGIARGYIEFFEPDAFIEAEPGLLESVGLASLRQDRTLHDRVVPLARFLAPQDDGGPAQPQFGLNVFDALRHIYKNERRFVLKHPQPVVSVKPEQGSLLTEVLFGAYPTDRAAKYIAAAFKDTYQPETLSPSPQAWRKVFGKGAQTPLRVTRYGLEASRAWHNDLVVFVFDPTKQTDVIELWNLRLEPSPVLPVPSSWLGELADDVRSALIAEHRPIRGNPNGVMHRATVEFARSFGKG